MIPGSHWEVNTARSTNSLLLAEKLLEKFRQRTSWFRRGNAQLQSGPQSDQPASHRHPSSSSRREEDASPPALITPLGKNPSHEGLYELLCLSLLRLCKTKQKAIYHPCWGLLMCIGQKRPRYAAVTTSPHFQRLTSTKILSFVLYVQGRRREGSKSHTSP